MKNPRKLDSNFLGFFMSKYSEAFKLSVVASYCSGNLSAGSVAETFGVDKAAVQKWAALYRHHGSAELAKKHSSYGAEFRNATMESFFAVQV